MNVVFTAPCCLCKKQIKLTDLIPLWKYVYCSECFDIVNERLEMFNDLIFADEEEFNKLVGNEFGGPV